MTRLRWRVSISSTVIEVWDCLVDWEHMHTWFLGVTRVTLLARAPFVGAIRLMQLNVGPIRRERITRWEPPNCFSITVVDPPLIARDWVADIDLRQHSAGVDLFWELGYEPRFGSAGRIIDWLLIRPCLDIAFRVSLRRLRTAIEAAHRDHQIPPG